MNIAECHYINGKLKEAEVESQRIIDFCKRWNPQESVRQLMFHALNNCGVCLQEMGNRNEAISHYKEAEKYADTQECIAIYINMADCYQQSGNFLECSKYYRKALTLAERPKANPNGIPFWQDWQNCRWKWKISRKQTSISEGSYILTYTNSIK